MAKKGFLLRIDENLLGALKRWADDDLRSLNGQIEFLLRKTLAEQRRLPRGKAARASAEEDPPDDE